MRIIRHYYYRSFATCPTIFSSKTTHTRNGPTDKVVLLLGWTDGQKRQLEKYAEIYPAMGIPSMMMLGTMYDVLSPKRIQSQIISNENEILDMFKEMNLICSSKSIHKKLIIHAFSNGGLWSLHQLHYYCQPFRQLYICGMILDSCPGGRSVTPSGYVRALTTSFTHPIIKGMMSSIVYIGAYIDIFLNHIYTERQSFMKSVTAISYIEPYNHLPKLYLYSTADNIVLSHDVEYYASLSQQQYTKSINDKNTQIHVRHHNHENIGQNMSTTQDNTTIKDSNDIDEDIMKNIHKNGVFIYNFYDSLHVQHYRKYPEKYRDLIYSFIKDI